ncbi:type II secretion system protein [Psychrosphaera sp. 1_MG-2023]|uniref:type IV pilus modification PilV family protein n=1 Tax=Psychrosphaera sp. 1_MG-2023 TaxID=3062643 RepID=UPI0026E1C06D|nr:type II secretion system protein [Psychrosphaera sp. 1_MG-2023]MDO6718118.1 type II secretion system protein [Psychrosphaera sp. 1_MG-2023]
MFARKLRLADSMVSSKLNSAKGFTLIELIIGIVLLAYALVFLTSALFPQAKKSTDPWFQVRSAELAQSFVNEILARRFDENSPLSGNDPRCDEAGGTACISDLPDCSLANVWTEESSRLSYDDVDDFHCFSASGDEITNIKNVKLVDVYKQFTVLVEVRYAGLDIGLAAREAKKIVVTVTPPSGGPIQYAAYKANY